MKTPSAGARHLIVELHDGDRSVRVEGPDGAAASERLVLADDLPQRTVALRRAMIRRSRQRLLRDIETPVADDGPPSDEKSLGEELFRAVFVSRLYGIYTVWRSQGGRLLLRLRVPASLSWVPWEFLRDPDQNVGLAATNGIALVRELDSARALQPSLIGPAGLAILAAGANPLDLPELAISKEKEILEAATRRHGTVEWIGADVGEVLRHLDDRERRDHVFHFAGHGTYDARGGALFFGDASARRTSSDQLVTLLASHATIRLVVLNACHGATSDADVDSPSIAAALVVSGVPAVLAMQSPILDTAALAAARGLYRALARGVPIEDAVGTLRRNLVLADLDWAAPVLTVANAERPLFVREAGLRHKLWVRAVGVVVLGLAVAAAVVFVAADRAQEPPPPPPRPELEWAQWPMPNPRASGLPNPAKYSTVVPGIVRDDVTELHWQRDVLQKRMKLMDATMYCAELELVGKGWRLPSLIELFSLVDFLRQNPAIDPAFDGTPAIDFFWTSSPVTGRGEHWVIGFFDGQTSHAAQDGEGFVRCVR